ncbi:SMC-Scp complex subunit ScpB [Streptomyces bohaiensis]|uniref:SMC-Scp complex subunit ScpB n=1 Tax=Streptomyces bohaiensis TaxID=1431344 RepID=UPI003B7DC987
MTTSEPPGPDTTGPDATAPGPAAPMPADPGVIPATPAAGSAPGRSGATDAPESADANRLPLRPALEAVLMVVDEPVREEHLARILDRPRQEVSDALRTLAQEYEAEQRGFDLRFVAEGWRFYTRAAYAPAVERFVLDGQSARLTQAALETLAVVAYRQPVSRSRVSAVRGVNCDGVMRTLLQRGLVEEAGTEPETGAILYGTTHVFLERLGLRGLDELPELAPFLPEAAAVEPDSQEAVPTFDVDSADPPT